MHNAIRTRRAERASAKTSIKKAERSTHRLEKRFDATFATRLALREKQIQQNYRPIIGIHKWFARRPGAIFRSLLLAEFAAEETLEDAYFRPHRFVGTIADPFMGGGIPTFEANRLGFHTIGTDINPMAYWIVRQSLNALDVAAFRAEAAAIVADMERVVGDLYPTRCLSCGDLATVKYFLWVKTAPCPECGHGNDLFPGYLVAEAERHPRTVVACAGCGWLNEHVVPPSREAPGECARCSYRPHVEGSVRRGKTSCSACQREFRVGGLGSSAPPTHRMWAIEYHCSSCKPLHSGRFFKSPDEDDLCRVELAGKRLSGSHGLPVPEDDIPRGDETDRLHRWGYSKYKQMFSERQQFGLGSLLKRISVVRDDSVRHALLTVFSDFLRYQNLLCRYDTYALKCQDIFSVHGFPVGLVECENNLLGIRGVGSGSFRHFVEKYARAKEYCLKPFEVHWKGSRKLVVEIPGETLRADIVTALPSGREPQALLMAADATRVALRPNSLDGVFTDPPYFDNVQYAELMDFCFAWLRTALRDEFPEFAGATTRAGDELTGNATLGRGLQHFTEGLSRIFCHYAAALKVGAPFAFTYHHNSPLAYVPIVVAILDAGLVCTAALPAAAEMSASLHIAGTGSSVLDTVFVCRGRGRLRSIGPSAVLGVGVAGEAEEALCSDAAAMVAACVHLTAGDLSCLLAGHVARMAVRELTASWNPRVAVPARMAQARDVLEHLASLVRGEALIDRMLAAARG